MDFVVTDAQMASLSLSLLQALSARMDHMEFTPLTDANGETQSLASPVDVIHKERRVHNLIEGNPMHIGSHRGPRALPRPTVPARAEQQRIHADMAADAPMWDEGLMPQAPPAPPPLKAHEAMSLADANALEVAVQLAIAEAGEGEPRQNSDASPPGSRKEFSK